MIEDGAANDDFRLLLLQPLARAKEFEAGAVKHNMDWSVLWTRKIGSSIR